MTRWRERRFALHREHLSVLRPLNRIVTGNPACITRATVYGRTPEFSSRRPCRGRYPETRRGIRDDVAPVYCNDWFGWAPSVLNPGRYAARTGGHPDAGGWGRRR